VIPVLGVDRYANAQADQYIFPPNAHGALETTNELACNARGVVTVRYLRQNDVEFIAADPGKRIAVANLVSNDLGHGLEQFITHQMAVGIVNCLEAIDVDIKQGKRAVMPRGLGVCLAETILK
jgi:hypothetical protein